MKNKVAVSLARVYIYIYIYIYTLCLVNKKEKSNKVEKYKQERNLLKKIGFSSCFFAFKNKKF